MKKHGNQETANIGNDSINVNGRPATIRPVMLKVKGTKYRYQRLTWYTTDGQRKQQCFPTEKQAEQKRVELLGADAVETERQRILSKRIGEYGQRLDRDRLMDAANALEILGGRVSLAEAAREYVARHPVGPSETIRETCNRYIEQMKADELRPTSIRDKRWKFDTLCKDLGNKPTLQLDDMMLNGWIKKHGYRHATADSFRVAVRNLRNFYAGTKKQRSAQRGIPETWKCEKVRELFTVAEKQVPEIIPAMVILWMAGVRPDETRRLVWEKHIDLTAKLIHIPPEIAKTHTARNVDLQPAAVEWLMKYRGTGKVISSYSTFRRARTKLLEALKIAEWPRDCPRHTYATMTYKNTENMEYTMEQLGHFGGPATFKRHYKGQPVTREQAAEYFNIRPGGAAEPITIPTAAAKAAGA